MGEFLRPGPDGSSDAPWRHADPRDPLSGLPCRASELPTQTPPAGWRRGLLGGGGRTRGAPGLWSCGRGWVVNLRDPPRQAPDPGFREQEPRGGPGRAAAGGDGGASWAPRRQRGPHPRRAEPSLRSPRCRAPRPPARSGATEPAGRCDTDTVEWGPRAARSVLPERDAGRRVRVRAQQPRGAAAQVLAAAGADGQAAALAELEQEVLGALAVAAHAAVAAGVPEPAAAACGARGVGGGAAAGRAAPSPPTRAACPHLGSGRRRR